MSPILSVTSKRGLQLEKLGPVSQTVPMFLEKIAKS